jgi:hypothetical protein
MTNRLILLSFRPSWSIRRSTPMSKHESWTAKPIDMRFSLLALRPHYQYSKLTPRHSCFESILRTIKYQKRHNQMSWTGMAVRRCVTGQARPGQTDRQTDRQVWYLARLPPLEKSIRDIGHNRWCKCILDYMEMLAEDGAAGSCMRHSYTAGLAQLNEAGATLIGDFMRLYLSIPRI